MTEIDDKQFERCLSRTKIDDTPRPEHRTQLRQQMLAKFDIAQSVRPLKNSSGITILDWRTIMRHPISRVATLTLMVVVTFSVFLISTDKTDQVWADMVTTILNTKTARFKVTSTVKDKQPVTVDVMLLEPNRSRQEMPAGIVQIADRNVGKIIKLDPVHKKAMLFKFDPQKKDQNPPSFLQRFKKQLLEEKSNPQVTRESLGKKKINGRTVVGFRIIGPLQTSTIWGDPVSGLPYRIESTLKMFPDTEVVMSDFEINVELDSALFSLEPPPGYAVITLDIPTGSPTEKDLVTALRTYSDHANGAFPDILDMKATFHLYKLLGLQKADSTAEETKLMMELSMKLTRGIGFALNLPKQADATYAGKNVLRAMTDKPIFWYKPEGAETFRVIYANLSTKEVDQAPQVENAQPLSKSVKAGS